MDSNDDSQTGLSPEGPQHVNHDAIPRQHHRRAPKFVVVFLAILLLAVIAGSTCWLAFKPAHDVSSQAINKGEFQALFLTNGQVYFGKLSNLDEKYVTLTDIYYLQVQQSQNLQQGSSTSDTNSNVSLAKLGNELHGPEDKMEVSSQQVLFWENLKSTSKVVQAIDKYQGQ